MKYFTILSPVALALVLGFGSPVLADAGHGKGMNFGKPGKPSQVTRSIDIIMGDNDFKPDSITVKKGETIRFMVRNDGEMVHEFAVGTPDVHVGHRQEMIKMMEDGILAADQINHGMMKQGGMMHDDPNSVLLEPGKAGEVIWTFTRDTTMEFACNVPGHYESGMVGKFHFQ